MFPATPLPAATDSTPETSVSVCSTTREQTGKKGKNIYEYKYSLLFDREIVNTPDVVKHNVKVGIPRILNIYEEYPFWNALLRAAGLGVILSSDSTFSQYEGALNTVMSDNICFPAKLAHSHLKELNENPR